MKMVMQIKLIPLRVGMSYETIQVWTRVDATDWWYPTAIVHIDTFYSNKQKELYQHLVAGDEVEMEVTMEEMI
jgi:hypothetical protein